MQNDLNVVAAELQAELSALAGVTVLQVENYQDRVLKVTCRIQPEADIAATEIALKYSHEHDVRVDLRVRD